MLTRCVFCNGRLQKVARVENAVRNTGVLTPLTPYNCGSSKGLLGRGREAGQSAFRYKPTNGRSRPDRKNPQSPVLGQRTEHACWSTALFLDYGPAIFNETANRVRHELTWANVYGHLQRLSVGSAVNSQQQKDY